LPILRLGFSGGLSIPAEITSYFLINVTRAVALWEGYRAFAAGACASSHLRMFLHRCLIVVDDGAFNQPLGISCGEVCPCAG
jgi:hypothetical protein